MKYQKTASRMLSSNHSYLQLIRLGIGHSAEQLCEPVDWNAMESLATKQGLLGVVLDGIQQLPDDQRPPKVQMLQWIGQVMQGYEQRYAVYRKAIDALAAFYNAHGFRMMLLKGYACGSDWPRPEHRPYGDIDIWLFGKQKEADAMLAKETGIEIDSSHHHHTVFNWMGFTVENHYDFVNVQALRASAEMEKVFKELGRTEDAVLCHTDPWLIKLASHSTAGSGQVADFYLPSANLHSLFLLKHSISHFVGANINLRQVLDWAFFVEKHTDEIDWEWLDGMIDRFHMNDFVGCLNAICVEDLGFDAAIFKGVQFTPTQKDRVLADILEPAFTAETPKPLIPRVIFKYRRWKGNGWKHQICYGTSRWDGFWTLLMSNLMKPEV